MHLGSVLDDQQAVREAADALRVLLPAAAARGTSRRPGIVCGIIALVLANKGMTFYNSNPNNYSIASFNNLKAGKVCAIIGLCLSSLIFIFYMIYFIALGAAFSMVPWSTLH